jgi:hypothetical protein
VSIGVRHAAQQIRKPRDVTRAIGLEAIECADQLA